MNCTSTIRRIAAVSISAMTLAALASCAETSQLEATGKGTIRGVNAIVTAPELNFMIEERSIGSASFREAAGFAEWDDLSYNFNFDILFPGDSATTRLVTQFIDVVADTEYTVVITGTVANPSVTYWESPERDWDGTETVFRADVAHLSPALGEVDVYFAPLGTAPVLGNAVDTLGFGERAPYADYPDDDYELILTPRDDPTTILYQSESLSSTPATSVTLALFDADPSITADVAVSLINATGGSASLPDARIPSNFRLFHAAYGNGNVDGYLDNDFSSPLFPAVAFADISSYADISNLTTPFAVTDESNSGAVIHEADITIARNARSTVIFGGEPGAELFRELIHDARPLETIPVIRFTNMSYNAEFVTIYLLEPGTVIDEDTIAAFNGMPTLLDTGFFGPEADTYEVTLTLFDDLTPISVPFTIDLANGDIADFVILDTADPTMVDLYRFDPPVP